MRNVGIRPGRASRGRTGWLGADALLALIVGAGLGSAAMAQAPDRVTQGLVLVGATVVDTEHGALRPDMAVVIEGGRIVRIAPAASVAVEGSAQRIDARGKFVTPGYLDMHAHALGARPSLRLMLANGITGYRQMSGSPELLEQYRADRRTSSPDLPELLSLPGTILTGMNAATPEAAVAEVQRQKAQGADFIKMIDVPPPAFFAAVAEARRLGLTVVGHLPPLVDVAEASRAGMHAIEHMGPKEGLILGCSSDEPALRRSLEDHPPTMPPIVGEAGARTMALALANPMVFTTPLEIERIGREIDTHDATRCRDLMRTFVENDTWQSPTLIRVRTMQYGADSGAGEPHIGYLPAAQRGLFVESARLFAERFSPEQQDVFKRLFDHQLRLVKLFDDNGVRMLAGTDGREVPGFGFHSELDLFEQAGLSPLRVLQLATRDGARFLGREATMGSVEAGKNADLVLLDANPLDSVQNLHRIHGVVRAGVFYSQADLAAMIREVGDAMAATPAPQAAHGDHSH